MSASKTNFFQGIVLALKEMSKIFINLSKKVERIEENQTLVEKHKEETAAQMSAIIKQHMEIINHIKQISNVQGEIAQQLVKQHEDIETLYIGLGLKKDLSYYSFDMMNAEEH